MNYLGKYKQLPETIEKLIEFEIELQKEGYSLDRELNLIIQSDYFAYNVTPYDVVPFASTGCDGIHFGFLTDYSSIENLEQAFVVCISPMNFGNHVKIVARNIKEFLNLIITMKSAVAIENFLNFEVEKDYIRLNMSLEIDSKQEYSNRVDYVTNKLKSAFECKAITNIFNYIENEVKFARNKVAIVPTIDGIGVVPLDLNFTIDKFELKKDMRVNIEELGIFFKNTSLESKLAIIRNLQFLNLIDDFDMQEFIKKEMLKLNLTTEALRLEWQYE
jgi:hypothetical protein